MTKNNKPPYCIEYFHIKPEYRNQFIQSILSIQEKSRKEQGCLQYDVLADSNDPNFFIIVMKFETPAQMDAHVHTEHVQYFIKNEMDIVCESVTWNDATLLTL